MVDDPNRVGADVLGVARSFEGLGPIFASLREHDANVHPVYIQ